ncbi:Hypothetical protein, DUF1814 family [Metamycoplasma alkalescens 14918]|uniref:Nucleotidyl transferase AbiEii/AbiGii toxin family protein n=1 Tax=Metamycoplasma alkalescens 14918 TaxID=1188234 RepID=N9SRL7_9BACT|nr:nucleotidyl transferase AbiEii/AbiGii toxin family protein [Metamycoplasma alkalescens]ENY54014.1 Hypothetical protein, DUF1814 family [Metamycoplasma alkalescens 14918]
MLKILNLPKFDLNLVIEKTSQKTGISEDIIEKDLWVCFVLKYLFTNFLYKDYLVFKGGTSLSKGFNYIKRFSEDIDIVLDWRILNLLKLKDVYYDEKFINRKRNEATNKDFLSKYRKRMRKAIKDLILPQIQEDFEKQLKNKKFKIYIDNVDGFIIWFEYPHNYANDSKYVMQKIKIELGYISETNPEVSKQIQTYVNENNQFLPIDKIEVKMVAPIRTFFEKLLILHRECNRPEKNKHPKRYSRHFYDVYQMLQTEIKNESLTNFDLLKKIIDFKKNFYPSNFANYDDILKGNITIVPNKESIEYFSKDYEQMKFMIFEQPVVTFKKIIDTLREYEKLLDNAIKEFISK